MAKIKIINLNTHSSAKCALEIFDYIESCQNFNHLYHCWALRASFKRMFCENSGSGFFEIALKIQDTIFDKEYDLKESCVEGRKDYMLEAYG